MVEWWNASFIMFMCLFISYLDNRDLDSIIGDTSKTANIHPCLTPTDG